jgi:hypothetical protein
MANAPVVKMRGNKITQPRTKNRFCIFRLPLKYLDTAHDGSKRGIYGASEFLISDERIFLSKYVITTEPQRKHFLFISTLVEMNHKNIDALEISFISSFI